MRPLARFRPLLALAALGLVLGCGDAAAPTSPKPAPQPAPQPDASLIVCTLQPEQRSSATIGPNGGTLSFGPHSLVIPKGALRAPTRITADAVRGYHARVEFSPSGLQFDVPATVTLSYAKCAVSKAPVQVVYMQSDTTVTETEPSHDDRDERSVSARIKHFSSYAVAY